ncbi:hypothetical protein ZHAS_00002777 [Anopheles sinensis]|uniref:Uncharacterized protein n=1 Tax=Anopheles sinensis TaxID=74873 RepID=A0A084VD03_ANOSI|nr:hypothetical protein ZHAS_00002777 [Anopheles sinensis]
MIHDYVEGQKPREGASSGPGKRKLDYCPKTDPVGIRWVAKNTAPEAFGKRAWETIEHTYESVSLSGAGSVIIVGQEKLFSFGRKVERGCRWHVAYFLRSVKHTIIDHDISGVGPFGG